MLEFENSVNSKNLRPHLTSTENSSDAYQQHKISYPLPEVSESLFELEAIGINIIIFIFVRTNME
ncbi:unnamed protein product [Ceratitis capitata]|uniref:(Mediterranean fruit fly) hypothetical protein n=1 Tax=Ceratitis capitata TaxID=7213 RepID=A0A811VB14_CERCA|nr:unnamed protein product [Ceratitis capitata]